MALWLSSCILREIGQFSRFVRKITLILDMPCVPWSDESAFGRHPSVLWSDESPFARQPSVPWSDESAFGRHPSVPWSVSMSTPLADSQVYLGLMSHHPHSIAMSQPAPFHSDESPTRMPCMPFPSRIVRKIT